MYCATVQLSDAFNIIFRFKENKIKVNPDQRARPDYNWRKHITVKKSRNLRRTFGGMFWIRGHQTSILGATTLSRRAQKNSLRLQITFENLKDLLKGQIFH